MRKLLLAIGTILLLNSCGDESLQIITTKSTNTKVENDFYVYENETVKVTYQFWHDRGLMSFTVYNKLDAPIYIDWSKSCLINNSTKLNYWAGESCSAFRYFGHHYYSGKIEAPGYNVDELVGVSSSAKSAMLEKVTFIPPKSNYYRSQFHFWPEDFMRLDRNKFDIVQSNENPKEKTKVWSADYDKSNSPLSIRNYIAVSKTSNTEDCTYIDNEFYVSSVKEMTVGHALGKYVKKNRNYEAVYEQPYKSNTSFYIIHYNLVHVEGIYQDSK